MCCVFSVALFNASMHACVRLCLNKIHARMPYTQQYTNTRGVLVCLCLCDGAMYMNMKQARVAIQLCSIGRQQ